MKNNTLKQHAEEYRRQLLDSVIPFWQNHSPDPVHGGYYNCLHRDGTVYDTQKHIWLQGRQVWMFSKLYNRVEAKPEWLELAQSGLDFLRKHAVRPDRRVYFCLSEDGLPVYMQRKIFSECFYTMALAEYSRATGEIKYFDESTELFQEIEKWSNDLTLVGRPAYEGATPLQQLAIPMILLNLIEEIDPGNNLGYDKIVRELIDRMLLHVHPEKQLVYEHVLSDGSLHDSSDGRLINPGHAIEAGWFLQHWAIKLGDEQLKKTAINMVRWSHDFGWDEEHGGLYYFLDAEAYSPTPLEWFMKLWWPHCEALYAHLLNYQLTGSDEDWQRYLQTYQYTFDHFPDETYGEWLGYLDRQGNPTHQFKGGPYKGCFHLPRTMWLCWKKAEEIASSN